MHSVIIAWLLNRGMLISVCIQRLSLMMSTKDIGKNTFSVTSTDVVTIIFSVMAGIVSLRRNTERNIHLSSMLSHHQGEHLICIPERREISNCGFFLISALMTITFRYLRLSEKREDTILPRFSKTSIITPMKLNPFPNPL